MSFNSPDLSSGDGLLKHLGRSRHILASGRRTPFGEELRHKIETRELLPDAIAFRGAISPFRSKGANRVRSPHHRSRGLLMAVVALTLSIGSAILAQTTFSPGAFAQGTCSATYSISSQWGGGFNWLVTNRSPRWPRLMTPIYSSRLTLGAPLVA